MADLTASILLDVRVAGQEGPRQLTADVGNLNKRIAEMGQIWKAVDTQMKGVVRTQDALIRGSRAETDSEVRRAKALSTVEVALKNVTALTDKEAAATRINARVATDAAKAQEDAARRTAAAWKSNINTIESATGRLRAGFQSVAFASGAMLTAGVGAAVAVGKALLDTNASFEALDKSITALTGDNGAFAKLQKYALLSPLSSGQTVTGARNLLGAQRRLTVDEILRRGGIMDTLTRLAAGTGDENGPRDLTEIIRQFQGIYQGNWRSREMIQNQVGKEFLGSIGIGWDDKKNRPAGLDASTGPQYYDRIMAGLWEKWKNFDVEALLKTKITNIQDAFKFLFYATSKAFDDFAKPLMDKFQGIILRMFDFAESPGFKQAAQAIQTQLLGPMADRLMTFLNDLATQLEKHPQMLTEAVVGFANGLKLLAEVFVGAQIGAVLAGTLNGMAAIAELLTVSNPLGLVVLATVLGAAAIAFAFAKDKIDAFTGAGDGAAQSMEGLRRQLREGGTVEAITDTQLATALLNDEIAKQGQDQFWAGVFKNLQHWIDLLNAANKASMERTAVTSLGEKRFKGQASTKWDVYSFLGAGPQVTQSGGETLMVEGADHARFRLTYDTYSDGSAARFAKEHGGMFYQGTQIQSLNDVYQILGQRAMEEGRADLASSRRGMGDLHALDDANMKTATSSMGGLPPLSDDIEGGRKGRAKAADDPYRALASVVRDTGPGVANAAAKAYTGLVDNTCAAAVRVYLTRAGFKNLPDFRSTRDVEKWLKSVGAQKIDLKDVGPGDIVFSEDTDKNGLFNHTGISVADAGALGITFMDNRMHGKGRSKDSADRTEGYNYFGAAYRIPVSVLTDALGFYTEPQDLGPGIAKGRVALAALKAMAQAPNELAALQILMGIGQYGQPGSVGVLAEQYDQSRFDLSMLNADRLRSKLESQGNEKGAAFVETQMKAQQVARQIQDNVDPQKIGESLIALQDWGTRFAETAPELKSMIDQYVERIFSLIALKIEQNAYLAAHPGMPTGLIPPGFNIDTSAASDMGGWTQDCSSGQCFWVNTRTGEKTGNMPVGGKFNEKAKKDKGNTGKEQADKGLQDIGTVMTDIAALISAKGNDLVGAIAKTAQDLLSMAGAGQFGPIISGGLAIFNALRGKKHHVTVDSVDSTVVTKPENLSISLAANPSSRLFAGMGMGLGAGFNVHVSTSGGAEKFVNIAVNRTLGIQQQLDGRF